MKEIINYSKQLCGRLIYGKAEGAGYYSSCAPLWARREGKPNGNAFYRKPAFNNPDEMKVKPISKQQNKTDLKTNERECYKGSRRLCLYTLRAPEVTFFLPSLPSSLSIKPLLGFLSLFNSMQNKRLLKKIFRLLK